MKNIEALKEILQTPKKVAIVSHRNPDGDAIGSSLGLFHYLSRKGHDATVIFPSRFPLLFDYLPGIDYTIVDDDYPDKTQKVCEEADIIFCLDFNSLARIDRIGEVIAAQDTPKVMIDHHLNPDEFAEFFYSDPKASSTCEMLYHFIRMMDDEKLVDKVIGECLYTGILTDTGSFSYSTSPTLYRTVADIYESGIDGTFVQNKIFNGQNEKQLRLLGYSITEAMRLYNNYNTGIIVLDMKDHRRFRIKRGDTEGIVNYILKMKNMRMAILMCERETCVKMSFRSKGAFSVQEICQKYFDGGGHRNASGGVSHDTIGNTIKKLKEIFETYKDELTAEPDY